MPPIRRLPSILWLRIKNHLREYIVEKEANDTKVLFWYHRRFVEVNKIFFLLHNFIKAQTEIKSFFFLIVIYLFQSLKIINFKFSFIEKVKFIALCPNKFNVAWQSLQAYVVYNFSFFIIKVKAF